MGVYDQLAKLPQTPPVASPEPPKTAETPRVRERQPRHGERTSGSRKEVSHQPHLATAVIDSKPNRQRNITRTSYEVYQDQLNTLREISLTAKLSGNNVSMSELVREAIDDYLHHEKHGL